MQLKSLRHMTETKGAKIRRTCVRLSAEHCGAPATIRLRGRTGRSTHQPGQETGIRTHWCRGGGGWSGVCACARPGQWASSPAVSDVTVGLCVSGVWSKSITESKKPNATNHVHNNSSIVLCLTLTLFPPSSGSLAEHKCSYSGQRMEYRIAVTHSALARMQTAEALLRRVFPTNLSATCCYQQR